jgi:hypothetical protein
MSTRENAFVGSGKLSPRAIQKLNRVANHANTFGVNGTSPVMVTPHGTVTLYRKRNYSEGGDAFPWDKLLFGYSIVGNVFTVLKGEIHFKNIIYPVAEIDLTIAADGDYVYVEMEWGTGTTAIKHSANIADATSSSSGYRKWLYQLSYTAPSTVSVKLYGHMGGAIDLMPILG